MRIPVARGRPAPGAREFRRAKAWIRRERRGANDFRSSSNPRTRGDLPARSEPVAVRAELQAEPVVVNAQIAVAAACYCARHHRLHLLCHHADIGSGAAEVAEAVIAEAVVEMAEQDDVVLQR